MVSIPLLHRLESIVISFRLSVDIAADWAWIDEAVMNDIDDRRRSEPGRLHQMHDRSVYIENKKESAAINSLSISAKISSAAGSYEKTIKQNDSASDTTTLRSEPIRGEILV